MKWPWSPSEISPPKKKPTPTVKPIPPIPSMPKLPSTRDLIDQAMAGLDDDVKHLFKTTVTKTMSSTNPPKVIIGNDNEKVTLQIMHEGTAVATIHMNPAAARQYARTLLSNADMLDPQDKELLKTPGQ